MDDIEFVARGFSEHCSPSAAVIAAAGDEMSRWTRWRMTQQMMPMRKMTNQRCPSPAVADVRIPAADEFAAFEATASVADFFSPSLDAYAAPCCCWRSHHRKNCLRCSLLIFHCSLSISILSLFRQALPGPWTWIWYGMVLHVGTYHSHTYYFLYHYIAQKRCTTPPLYN